MIDQTASSTSGGPSDTGLESGDPGAVAPPDPPNRQARSRRRESIIESVGFAGFIVILLGFSLWLGGGFFDASARMLDIQQNTPVLLLALGLVVCLIGGQFDLSVAGMATLTAFLTVGLTVNQGWPFGLVVVACLVIGILGGLVNAGLVVGLRVHAFIATLGTAGIFEGLSNAYSGGTNISPIGGGPQLPAWFTHFGSFQQKVPSGITTTVIVVIIAGVAYSRGAGARRRGNKERSLVIAAIAVVLTLCVLLFGSVVIDSVPWTVGFLALVTFALWVVVRYTTFGRQLYAVGGNAQAAALSGVRVQRVTIAAFVLSGLLGATAGILLAAIQGSATPDAAATFLLPAFGAAFVSTVILSPGRFHILGTIAGGVFVIWVSQGLIVAGVPFTWAEVLNGIILVVAVAMSTVVKRIAAA